MSKSNLGHARKYTEGKMNDTLHHFFSFIGLKRKKRDQVALNKLQSDEGKPKFSVSNSGSEITLSFGKPDTWVVMNSQLARQLASALEEHATFVEEDDQDGFLRVQKLWQQNTEKNQEAMSKKQKMLPTHQAPVTELMMPEVKTENKTEEQARADLCCTLAGPGRGDCSHFVGLPGKSIPGQHDGPDDTVDHYGRPNGWCFYCWTVYKLEAAERALRTRSS